MGYRCLPLCVMWLLASLASGCVGEQHADDDTAMLDDDTSTDDDTDTPVDADNDGWDETEDCDDSDNTINPQAGDGVGDGIDQNCDGVDGTDEDGDGWASDWSGGDDCDDENPGLNHDDQDGDGVSTCAGDCDDTTAQAFPGAEVVCDDGLDNDCDGSHEYCGVESFVQTGNHQVDILFVVDNSAPTMNHAHEKLGATFEDMVASLDAAGVEYHVAVVTTDSAEFQGGGFLDANAGDLFTIFATLVQVGAEGSVAEQGYAFGLEALDLAATGQGPNAGFLRQRAGLRVIFCSDEDDQSAGDVASNVSAFQGFVLHPTHLRLNGFTGQITGCAGPSGAAYTSPRYDQGITATGGQSHSICEPDWSNPMGQLGADADHQADTFPLAQIPMSGDVVVEVDGQEVTTGWTLDAGLDAVVFDADSVPENGHTVDVQYTYVPASP